MIANIRKKIQYLSVLILLLLLTIAAIPARAEVVYFSDDFEGGLGKWTVSGSDWDLIDTDYVSPNHSVTDSPGAGVNFDPNANATLTLAYSIDLSTSTIPVLSYWTKFYFPDCGGYPEYTYDYGYVEISKDGGLTWTVLRTIKCVNVSSWYQPALIDLSAYKTSPVKIRFRLRADGDSWVGDGWYIDDVEIYDFGRRTYMLTVSKSGNGYCTITSTPSGIDCGDDCTQDYTDGTIVKLNVTLENGCVLAGWGGDCSSCTGPECIVTMDMDKTCDAVCNVAECAGKDVTIAGTPDDDIIEGTEGPDVIYGLGGNDIIIGFSGNDSICGGDGNDTLIDYKGKDKLYGDAGNDYLYGGDSDDRLYGGDGNDVLDGVDGNDTLKGEAGKDTLMGGDGDDNLNGGSGTDFCDGGPHVIGDTVVSCETVYNVP